MFIGHFAAGLAAKKLDDKPSLGTMLLASQFIDLLWPILVLIGVERVKVDPGNTSFTPLDFVHYPITHSFLGVLGWSVLFGLVYFIAKKNLKSSVVLGCLVLSHWFLDLLTHRPDLLILPWQDIKIGLGLWNSILWTVTIEGLIFIGGAYLYFKVTRSETRKGAVLLWSFLIFLSIVYIMNILGPPPPSADAIGYAGLSMWLLVAWGYWIDKNRIIIK